VLNSLFSSEYMLIWAAILAAALWIPLRHMIWVMSVRRARKKNSPSDESAQQKLKNRAGITAALLALVFSLVYTDYLFRLAP